MPANRPRRKDRRNADPAYNPAVAGEFPVTAPDRPPTAGPPRRSGPRAYLVAAGVSVTAWLFSQPLEPWVDPIDLPLSLGAVMLSAWYGGLGPGLLAAALGILTSASEWFSLGPWSAAAAPAPGLSSLVARTAVFLAEAVVISSLASGLRTAQHRAESLAARERTARSLAEEAATRVRHLQSVTDVALTYLDLDDLLRELLGRIRQSLSADTVVILLLSEDGRELAVRAAHGLEEEVHQGVRIPVGRGLAGRIAAERRLIAFEDVSQAEVWSPVLRDKRLRSLLGTPLVADDRVIGVVHVGTFYTRRFSEQETGLLRLTADRIAIAIEHARLYAAEQRARGAAEAAERRFRILVDGVRDYATYLLDAGGRVVSWNAGAERLKGYREQEVLGQSYAMFYTGEAVRAGAPDRVLASAAAAGRHEGEVWRVRKDGSRFWADVVVTALRDDEGRLEGFSVLTHDLSERKRAAEVRARLLDQVIRAQEDEQRRIARELHDETGQSLSSLLIGLRALQDAPALDTARAQAAQLSRMTARALDEVRRLARGLRPATLDELGLVAALEQQALEYMRARSVRVECRFVGLDGQRLPASVEAALYRIAQEALTNASEHGGAKTVTLVLERGARDVRMIVSDDGSGFDPEAALREPDVRAHLGLHGMLERAALLGGSVTIESAPGEGATVSVWVPLQAETADA
jgi:PAS domain S-box-containing protein